MFKIGLAGRPTDEGIDFDYLAGLTVEFSCADIIENVIESSARFAANHDLEKINQNILEKK